MTKYRTQFNRINEVEIERETEKQVVFVGGRRSSKRSSYENYFDTWEDAKQHLLDKAQKEVEGLRRRLETANGTLGNIKGMKQPD